MPAPSKLAIATSAVSRLLKEEASYHKELAQGEERIKKLETNNEGENADFQMKQEVRVLICICPVCPIVFPPNRLIFHRKKLSRRPKPSFPL